MSALSRPVFIMLVTITAYVFKVNSAITVFRIKIEFPSECALRMFCNQIGA